MPIIWKPFRTCLSRTVALPLHLMLLKYQRNLDYSDFNFYHYNASHYERMNQNILPSPYPPDELYYTTN